MSATVRPSAVHGIVAAPPSKSATHRALVLAALAKGVSKIHSPLSSEDTDATVSVLRGLGVEIKRGVAWVVRGSELHAPLASLQCGDSGTTLRLMSAVCGMVDSECRLEGGASLSKRPVGPLLDALNQIGVRSHSRDGLPPVTVYGDGSIDGGEARIPGDVSSQFVSALLIVAPLAESPVEINLTTPLESRPYVAMTLDTMRVFGVEAEASQDMSRLSAPLGHYTATELTVEGDWSSAAYILAAGALAGESEITGLDEESHQADRKILSILREMGAEAEVRDGHIRVARSRLKGIDTDLSNCPTGLARLRHKESDRVAAMAEGLTKMEADVRYDGSSATIRGGTIRGATVDPWGDHRVAMSLAVLALTAEGATTISEAGCVAKSYPGFWRDLASIGGRITHE
jgi:3-phosphoshikimate 1-carboxyvinyltransferase